MDDVPRRRWRVCRGRAGAGRLRAHPASIGDRNVVACHRIVYRVVRERQRLGLAEHTGAAHVAAELVVVGARETESRHLGGDAEFLARHFGDAGHRVQLDVGVGRSRLGWIVEVAAGQHHEAAGGHFRVDGVEIDGRCVPRDLESRPVFRLLNRGLQQERAGRLATRKRQLVARAEVRGHGEPHRRVVAEHRGAPAQHKNLRVRAGLHGWIDGAQRPAPAHARAIVRRVDRDAVEDAEVPAGWSRCRCENSSPTKSSASPGLRSLRTPRRKVNVAPCPDARLPTSTAAARSRWGAP